eukprot:CAMPEP_0204044550 /NCGR_PEP_ID=MMETSP0360-20130528/105384_1 /ASSEMBLY_ACC=CAM_ASM_000342 /TAXON_ID=268821 /ORGANISM="Scrippsiella Hangoei, Strain SHTV-5" /LENGTH=67 /DNA_ID=CAMNT_0050991017 /DNA_START=194 /DNA_END=393 /DNA_ORIENTATION=-
MTVCGSPVERPHSSQGVFLEAGLAIEQQLRDIVCTMRTCVMQGLPTIGDLLGVELCSGFQEHDTDLP